MRYIIFFTIGYYSYEYIQKLFLLDSLYKKIIAITGGLITFCYACLLFFGNDLLSYISINETTILICSILRPMILIYIILFISNITGDINLLCKLGQNTLFLCGSEYIINKIVPIVIQCVGLQLSLPNPMAIILYVFILLVICNKTLVPVEKKIIENILNMINIRKQDKYNILK